MLDRCVFLGKTDEFDIYDNWKSDWERRLGSVFYLANLSEAVGGVLLSSRP